MVSGEKDPMIDEQTTGDAVDALAHALTGFEAIDLTHTLQEGIPSYPTHAKFFRMPWQSMGDVAEMNQLILSDHSGTHVDSPSHFVSGEGDPARKHVHELDVDSFVGRAVKMEFGPFTATNELITAADISAWERAHVEVRAGDIVLLDLKWSERWKPIPEGFGFLEGWPGLDRSAAEHLAGKGVKAIGTDCISLDSGDGGRGELPAHLTLLPRGILIMENLANLARLPDVSFFVALPLKVKDATGSPVRAVALVPRAAGR
jgi:kynurenine formamidase